jgi:hypothetical protein
VHLTATTMLKAAAFADGLEASATTSALYRVLPSAVGPDGAEQCATEGSTCGFSGIGKVYYGANDSWIVGTFDRRVSCTASVFGGDPAPGTSKRCYVLALEGDFSAKPTITPAGGEYNLSQQVTITSPVSGAEIRYTENGSMPTETSTL